MDFYCGRFSGNSARAAFGLAEAGAPFAAHLLDTRSGENRSATYLAVNPVGKIPALVDGALKLWESNAIKTGRGSLWNVPNRRHLRGQGTSSVQGARLDRLGAKA